MDLGENLVYIVAGIMIVAAVGGYVYFTSGDDDDLDDGVYRPTEDGSSEGTASQDTFDDPVTDPEDFTEDLYDGADTSDETVDSGVNDMGDPTGGNDMGDPTGGNTVTMKVAGAVEGTITIKLEPTRAPVTVENFKKYANDGFYSGLIFHRVINGFMVQGGGFDSNMVQKTPTYSPIVNEAATSKMANSRGTIAMARTSDPNSATSQFYINHADNPSLDWDKCADGYGYCVFGTVTSGMEIVDAIANLPTGSDGGHSDVPTNDVIISSVSLS